MRALMFPLLLLAGFSFTTDAVALESGLDARTAQKLEQALRGDQRSPRHQARDQYRHPQQTLAFFGINQAQTVVEIWPSEGWYTEILAPLLKENGTLYEASFAETDPQTKPFRKQMAQDFRAKLAAHPDIYSSVILTELQAPQHVAIAPAGSADLVLTFRSVHNWLKDGNADQVFAAMFRALKPGGVLGVVEHRAQAGTPLPQMIKTGYVTEAEVIALAQAAGFKLAGSSEINANPRDSKDHPMGVWSLPPILRGGADGREHFLTIGESDRMTLKFVKP
ncbi:MAG TPA: methyltransferase [Methylophilaceae bacterium]|nr:methyltransferase [Methylophilaceae bacterium]